MKYGLMYYKYTDNIGDDIQTYVARKYLPHIDYYIDREALSCFIPNQKECVAVIMNGWFIHNKLAWPPSPYIKPLLISMHFKEQNNTDVGDLYLKGFGGEYLKQNEPVGARDTSTKKRLEKNNINAYFSGCMTLTLKKFRGVKKKNKICLVDVGQDIQEKVKQSTNCEIDILTHFLNQNKTAEKSIYQRMEEVEKYLKKYQEAKLVITTRLHAALPSVALGTPVIVIHKEMFDEDRLGTFFHLFENYIEDDFLKMDITEILRKPISNNKEYIKIKRSLDKVCKRFVRECEKNGNDISNLPDIEDYRKYAERICWYKQIYEKERLIVEKIEQKRAEEYQIYHKNIKELQKIIDEMRRDEQ